MKLNEIFVIYEKGEFMSLVLKERKAVVREVLRKYNKTKKKENEEKYQNIHYQIFQIMTL